jgi:6-phosphofructokinase 1
MRRVAILTSGGDAPGMNAALRAAALAALDAGWEVVGVNQGFRGLVDGSLRPLAAADVAPLLGRGGTFLGSARCPEMTERAVRVRARAVLAAASVDALVVIGGDGSMRGASALASESERGGAIPRVVGVPASIDNDLPWTCSIGADTALNTIVDACDRIADTAASHDRAFIVEVMGRDCGWLARSAGIAAGADAVLFPESGRSEAEMIAEVVAAIRRAATPPGARRALIIKAEGVAIPIDRLRDRIDQGLAAAAIAVETRAAVLGHIVRGGAPTAFDRVLATRLGRAAMRAAIAGADHVMATWRTPAATGDPAAPTDDIPCRFVELDEVCHQEQLPQALGA